MLKNGGTLKEVFMKARVLSLLTAGAVMTGLLTGCSGGTKNVEASGEAGKGYQKIELVMAVNGTDIQTTPEWRTNLRNWWRRHPMEM